MAFGGLILEGTSIPMPEVIPLIPDNSNWSEIESILSNEKLANSYAQGEKENCED